MCVVPHGVPPIQPHGRTRIKEQFDLSGRTIITTFGLVDPRKGLEHMIEAMRAVREHDPTALYLIVGKTHPELVRREGEAYRVGLCWWRGGYTRSRAVLRHSMEMNGTNASGEACPALMMPFRTWTCAPCVCWRCWNTGAQRAPSSADRAIAWSREIAWNASGSSLLIAASDSARQLRQMTNSYDGFGPECQARSDDSSFTVRDAEQPQLAG